MADLTLELGKVYICQDRPIKITAVVPEGTMEYDLGARFTSQHEHLYATDGTRVSLGKSTWQLRKRLERMGLEREATYDENLKLEYDVFNFDNLTPQQKLDYIPRSDSNFILRVGETYVNRFGQLEIITQVSHKKKSELMFASRWFSFDHYGNYIHRGRGSSMRDLIYMRKSITVVGEQPDIVKKILGYGKA